MARQSAILQSLTFIANGAVTAYRAVGFDGAQASAAGQKVFGVAQRAVADADAGDLDVAGTTVIEAGDAISIGDSLVVDDQGRAVPASGALAIAAGATQVTSTAANGAVLEGADLPEFVFGDALEEASAAGDLIEILLR